MSEVVCTLCKLKFYSETVPPHDCEHIRIKKLETKVAELEKECADKPTDVGQYNILESEESKTNQRVSILGLGIQKERLKKAYVMIANLSEFRCSHNYEIVMSEDTGIIYSTPSQRDVTFPCRMLAVFHSDTTNTSLSVAESIFDSVAKNLNKYWGSA